MKRTKISLLVAGLLATGSNALAQMAVSGSVTGGLLSTDLKSSNAYRFDEYRDMRSGVTLGADVKGESDKYFIRFFGENIGRDDQFMEVKGGQYGVFKYSLTNNNIIHNLTHNAITPFAGVGSNTLTLPNPVPPPASTIATLNTATWGRFDYSVKHENYGGMFELQPTAASPFYFRATGNVKETKGIKLAGNTANATSGPVVDLPVPLDYTTTDASAEVGYATKVSQYSLNASWSKFEDRNTSLTWRNPFSTNVGAGAGATVNEVSQLAPDNKIWKLAGNAMWKQLPMGSTLALRGTYSKNTNSLAVPTVSSNGGATPVAITTNPSSATFNGEIINKSFSASLTSRLVNALDSRIYWNWTEKENKSNQIVFAPRLNSTNALTQLCDLNPVTGVSLGTTCTTELFHYKKDNFGIDLQYRVNPQNKLSGGWDYVKTERERFDFEKTKDNKVYVEWKNSSYDALSAKIKYQHLDRDADFLYGGLNATLSDTNMFNKYLRRFDLNGVSQNLLKLVLDSTPTPFLDLGAELILKNNRYKDVTLGRKNDDRREIYFTASYGDPKKLRVTAFFDYEATSYEAAHYQGAPPANETFAASPAGSAANFLWTGKVKDKNYVIGLAGDWPYSERLKFRGSWTWQQTNGSVDFTANSTGPVILNVPNFDTFRKYTFDLRGTYAIDKNFDLNFGLAHENYKYTDAQMDNYIYTTVGGVNNYLSGAYANPNYTASMLYLSLKYMIQ